MRSLEAAMTFSFFDQYHIDFIGYKNKLDNAIHKQAVDERYRWVNDGEINTEGIEIYFRFSSKKLTSSINYTFNQSYDENDEFVPEISKHTGNVSATYHFSNHIKINFRANYIGERENPQIIASDNGSTIDPCLVFHGALSLLNYKGFTLQFIVKNLLNKEYYHTSNREPDRYRQPQRTVMVSVGYTLNTK
jgi:outer membrane receptor for ferrienterochelin and colicin